MFVIINMSTHYERLNEVKNVFVFTTIFLMPVEMTRIVAITTCVVPLLISHAVEYVVFGETRFTEKCADVIENGGKQYVKDMAIKMNIMDEIY